MESQFVAGRWCVLPRSQAAATGKLAGGGFKHRPVLNSMFFETRHFATHFVPDLVVAERAAEESHDVGIGPKTSSHREVVGLPGTEEQAFRAENLLHPAKSQCVME